MPSPRVTALPLNRLLHLKVFAAESVSGFDKFLRKRQAVALNRDLLRRKALCFP
jgi:hypothetical protein